jgi:predicted Zn-dependent peptidase
MVKTPKKAIFNVSTSWSKSRSQKSRNMSISSFNSNTAANEVSQQYYQLFPGDKKILEFQKRINHLDKQKIQSQEKICK